MGRTGGAAVRTLFCDANVLIRLLTGDPPGQAADAARALDAAAEGGFTVVIPDLVIAEVAYVSRSAGVPAADVATQLERLLALPGVEVVDRTLVLDALASWSSGRLDFADAYLAALGRRISHSAVLSFDRDFDRVEGVTRMSPASIRSAGDPSMGGR